MPAEGGKLVEPGGEVLLGAGEAVHQEQRTLPDSRLGDPKPDVAEVYISFCHHGPQLPQLADHDDRFEASPADSMSRRAGLVTDSKAGLAGNQCAASYLLRTSALIRPRSATAIPCSCAHWRTADRSDLDLAGRVGRRWAMRRPASM